MFVLGIHVGHDATAVLIKDNEVLYAIAEERLSRMKNHVGFPYLAIEKIMKDYNLNPSSIDKITFSFSDLFSYDKAYTREILYGKGRYDFAEKLPLYMRLRLVFLMFFRFLSLKRYNPDKYNYKYASGQYYKILRNMGFKCSVELVDHHMSHAASAYFSQSKKKVLIITIDGSGDGLCASVNIGENGTIKRLYCSRDDNSPGVFYSAITKYLGFKRLRHEGKITGLAAFGKNTDAYTILKKIFYLARDKKDFILEIEQIAPFRKIRFIWLLITEKYVLGKKSNLLLDYFHKNLFQFSREDVAWAAQKILEENIVDYVKNAVLKTGIKDVLLAGGVFANVKLNQALADLNCVDYLFIHPNMSDGGTAFGCAMLSMKNMNVENYLWKDVYLGPSYYVDKIKDVLKDKNIEIITDSVEDVVAKMLASGKIIGVMSGRMEYGPRALGNRSILVSAADKNINNDLNKKLKRTEFMPFAPIIMEEHFDEYFYRTHADIKECLKYMTITVNVKDLCKINAPAICHIDNTARPQFINKEINPGIYNILNKYMKITGVPLLVNTSFNVHEEPIVCDIKDAFTAFRQSSLDALLINFKYLLLFKN